MHLLVVHDCLDHLVLFQLFFDVPMYLRRAPAIVVDHLNHYVVLDHLKQRVNLLFIKLIPLHINLLDVFIE